MDEAFAFESSSAYIRWLIDQPDEAAPFSRVPRMARAAARGATKGQPREVIASADDRALREALLHVALVIKLNSAADECNRVEGLRCSCLYFQIAALMNDPLFEDKPGRDADPERAARLLSSWDITRRMVEREIELLRAEDAAYELLEGRYFDGRPALFPEIGEDFEALIEMGERLAGLAEDVTMAWSVPSLPDTVLALPAAPTPDERSARIFDEARVAALEMLGERQRATAIMKRWVLRGS